MNEYVINRLKEMLEGESDGVFAEIGLLTDNYGIMGRLSDEIIAVTDEYIETKSNKIDIKDAVYAIVDEKYATKEEIAMIRLIEKREENSMCGANEYERALADGIDMAIETMTELLGIEEYSIEKLFKIDF